MNKIRRSCSAGEGSSTSITDLPQSILIGIISRVPLRCAKRCSAVCKTWYKLLVKDEATSSYLQHWYGGGGGDDQMSSRRNSSSFALLTNMTTSFPGCSNRLWSWVVAAAYSSAEEDTVGIWPRLMLRPCNDDDNEQRFRYSNEVRGSSGQRMEVVACCNDVLLCEEWRSAANDSAAYCVWEPVSGDHNWVPLPVINRDRSSTRRRFLCGLVCDPDGSFTVIRITASERPSGCVLMHTFSNRSREDSWAWKEHRVDWPAGQEFLWVEHHPQGVMYKGFMFWLGAKHALFGVDLDPRRHHHHHPVLITLPPEFRYIGNECLGVCRGSLTIVQMSDNPSPLAAAYVAIWILNHGSSSRSGNSVDEFCNWSLHKRVSLQQVIGSADPFRRPPTSDLSGDASLPRMGRLKLLGRHPYELDIVYFRVWRTVFSLDLSSKGAPLRRLFVYPSDTYPLNTSMGLPVNSFTFIPQWRPTPIRTFAVDSLFINYLECM